MNNTLPLVSIIMPVYNAEKYIKQALETILNQTYTNLEILIADDGSTDSSKKIINTFDDSRIHFFHNDSNIGYLKTCNKLFKKSNGNFIGFQDADDWSDNNRIEKIMSKLLECKDLAMCGCNFIRLNDNDKKIVTKSNYPTEDNLIKEFINKNNNLPFCGASVIIKKEIYKNIGGYKLFFDRIGYEHFDWFLRISEKYKIANISDHLYYYRYIPNSFSRSDKLTNFKKFYARDIAFFLKKQRQNNNNNDGLSNPKLKIEFDVFLKQLEQNFDSSRKVVYDSLIKNNISNKAYYNAYKLSLQGLKNKELSVYDYLYYNYRILRSFIAKYIK